MSFFLRSLILVAFLGVFVKIFFDKMKTSSSSSHQIISHQPNKKLDLKACREHLRSLPNPALPLEEELEMLDQLTKFDLGKFLLKNRGLNGYWIDYMILHDKKKQPIQHPLEEFLLYKSPGVLSTKERFYIFKEQIEKYAQSNMTLASVPCGLMSDLLLIDDSKLNNLKYVGIDLDDESLQHAKRNAKKRQKQNQCSFHQKNAWDIGIKNQYNVLISNGLNIYEPDDQKVMELYKNFHQALQPGGILITSFLTPPQKDVKRTPEEAAVLKKQIALFVDILQVKWRAYRTEETTRTQLVEAGFEVVEFIYDSQRMCPTVIARKPS